MMFSSAGTPPVISLRFSLSHRISSWMIFAILDAVATIESGATGIAKAAGKPVKLQWTREEEFTWAYFRPAGVIDVRSGADHDGTITSYPADYFPIGGKILYSDLFPDRKSVV